MNTTFWHAIKTYFVKSQHRNSLVFWEGFYKKLRNYSYTRWIISCNMEIKSNCTKRINITIQWCGAPNVRKCKNGITS